MNKFAAVVFDLDDTLYDTSNRLPGSNVPNFAEMHLYDGVKELLLKIESKKILLTHGDREIQNKKIDTLDIRNLFDEIVIVEEGEDKLRELTRIKNQFGNSSALAVVGDRRDREIRYGNILGFTTILVEGFKYKDLKPSDDLEIPTFDLKNILELADML